VAPGTPDFFALMVGAVLAIAGGAAGQLGAFYLKDLEQRKAYRRDKLDQVMLAIFEDEHWLEAFRSSLCFGDGSHTVAEPFDKVRTAIFVYFEAQLGSAVVALHGKRNDYTSAVRTAYSDRLGRAVAEGRADVKSTAPTAAHLDAIKVTTPHISGLIMGSATGWHRSRETCCRPILRHREHGANAGVLDQPFGELRCEQLVLRLREPQIVGTRERRLGVLPAHAGAPFELPVEGFGIGAERHAERRSTTLHAEAHRSHA
jgi:hypothetical protein